jgi:hypothetical protein
MKIVVPSEASVAIREQLQDAVNAGNILIPYHESGLTHVEPWPPTTVNYDPQGNPITDPPEGRVVGTRDVDVAIFAAITGYMGPKAVVPPGSARIMQRVNRFSDGETPAVSSIYGIAALSFAGKIALRHNEASGSLPTLVYWANSDQFEPRPGLFPYKSLSSVAVAGGVKVSSAELGVDPYELPAVEGVWTQTAFDTFAQQAGYNPKSHSPA